MWTTPVKAEDESEGNDLGNVYYLCSAGLNLCLIFLLSRRPSFRAKKRESIGVMGRKLVIREGHLPCLKTGITGRMLAGNKKTPIDPLL